jgi:phage terminase small subunit
MPRAHFIFFKGGIQMPRARDLTPRQQSFIEHYLTKGVGSKAAVAAGYPARSARKRAWALLSNPRIAEEVARRRGEIQKQTGCTLESMLARFDADHAFAVANKNPSAAASVNKAKLAGLMVDRIDQRVATAVVVEVVKFGGEGQG